MTIKFNDLETKFQRGVVQSFCDGYEKQDILLNMMEFKEFHLTLQDVAEWWDELDEDAQLAFIEEVEDGTEGWKW